MCRLGLRFSCSVFLNHCLPINIFSIVLSLSLDYTFTRVIFNLRWQKHVVEKIIDRLASLIASSKQSMVERERRKKESEARLDLLEHKVGKVCIYRM